MAKRQKVAIIGAGLSGLIAARRLSDRADVVVIEKSRGLGGRMSTRRAEPFHFDHGAQYFRAGTSDFIRFVGQMMNAGHIAEWQPRLIQIGAERTVTELGGKDRMFTATPAMNSLCKHLGEGVTILRSKRVVRLARTSGDWTMTCEDGENLTGFDWVVSTAPAEQTRTLLPENVSFRDALQDARMTGCFTLMLGFAQAQLLDWDAAKVEGPMLGWIADNSAKPGREGGSAIVIQTTNDWAERNLERPLGDVEAEIRAEFQTITGVSQVPIYQSLHRWRYAAVGNPAHAPFLLDAATGLAAAGDWCGDGKVEAAYLSGQSVADAIATRL